VQRAGLGNAYAPHALWLLRTLTKRPRHRRTPKQAASALRSYASTRPAASGNRCPGPPFIPLKYSLPNCCEISSFGQRCAFACSVRQDYWAAGMRGALDEKVEEVYRFYTVPASNTAVGHTILENRPRVRRSVR
jgi:hypothetical protein